MVKRYDIEETLMQERPEGEYVCYGDYAALEKELNTLRHGYREMLDTSKAWRNQALRYKSAISGE